MFQVSNSFIFRYTAIASLCLVVFFGFGLPVGAQTAAPCDAACRTKLEAELAQYQKEIDDLGPIIEAKRREGVSLSRDVELLNTLIQKAKLAIKARNLAISGLSEDIGEKKKVINKYSAKIEREKESLASLMRRTHELDNYSIIEVVLSEKPLSEFFVDLDAFEYIEDAISKSLNEVSIAKVKTEEAKLALEEKKAKETDLKYQKEQEKKMLDANEAEKKRVLTITKGQEKEYQKVLKEKQARAASIRAQLFSLRDTGEIPFGQALDYANQVSQKTGVRPAFLLAIFMQESGFGKNVGACYLKDTTTGGGVGKNTGTPFAKVMAVTRNGDANKGDVKPFLDLMLRLGRDPYTTQVSCPQQVGFGGAMGPAQFIPSTWVLYENLIKNALGIDVPDPWRARDAFMAAGFLLKDNGAKANSYSAERNAACKYFSGRSCANSSWAATYGTQVMKKAETIQATMIDPIENS